MVSLLFYAILTLISVSRSIIFLSDGSRNDQSNPDAGFESQRGTPNNTTTQRHLSLGRHNTTHNNSKTSIGMTKRSYLLRDDVEHRSKNTQRLQCSIFWWNFNWVPTVRIHWDFGQWYQLFVYVVNDGWTEWGGEGDREDV